MQLTVDLDSLELIVAPADRKRVSRIETKRGDGTPMEISFVRSGVLVRLAAGTVVTFAAKADTKYDSDPLVLESGFTAPADPADPVYSASPSFNTGVLNALFLIDGDDSNDPASVDLMAEITWAIADNEPTSTRTFAVRVHNDVYRGDELTPSTLPTPDDYVAARAVLYDREQALTAGERNQVERNLHNLATIADPTALSVADFGKAVSLAGETYTLTVPLDGGEAVAGRVRLLGPGTVALADDTSYDGSLVSEAASFSLAADEVLDVEFRPTGLAIGKFHLHLTAANAVSFLAQNLDVGQRAQARGNLGLGAAATRTVVATGNLATGADDGTGDVVGWRANKGIHTVISSGDGLHAETGGIGATAIHGEALATDSFAINLVTNAGSMSLAEDGSWTISAGVGDGLIAELGLPELDADNTFTGTDNRMPNQTPVNGASLMTRELSDARYDRSYHIDGLAASDGTGTLATEFVFNVATLGGPLPTGSKAHFLEIQLMSRETSGRLRYQRHRCNVVVRADGTIVSGGNIGAAGDSTVLGAPDISSFALAQHGDNLNLRVTAVNSRTDGIAVGVRITVKIKSVQP